MLNHANNGNNIYLNSNSLSILILDDSFDIVRFMKRALMIQEFHVSAFTDPIMALEYFKLNCKICKLIISDNRMPGMNGYEFLKKAKEIDNQVKVILMSSFEIYNDEEFHNVLSDIKIDGFLQKPLFNGKVKRCYRTSDGICG